MQLYVIFSTVNMLFFQVTSLQTSDAIKFISLQNKYFRKIEHKKENLTLGNSDVFRQNDALYTLFYINVFHCETKILTFYFTELKKYLKINCSKK